MVKQENNTVISGQKGPGVGLEERKGQGLVMLASELES